MREWQQPIISQRVALDCPEDRVAEGRWTFDFAAPPDDSPQPPVLLDGLVSNRFTATLAGPNWLVGFFLSFFLFSLCHFLVGQLVFETRWQTSCRERYCNRLRLFYFPGGTASQLQSHSRQSVCVMSHKRRVEWGKAEQVIADSETVCRLGREETAGKIQQSKWLDKTTITTTRVKTKPVLPSGPTGLMSYHD